MSYLNLSPFTPSHLTPSPLHPPFTPSPLHPPFTPSPFTPSPPPPFTPFTPPPLTPFTPSPLHPPFTPPSPPPPSPPSPPSPLHPLHPPSPFTPPPQDPPVSVSLSCAQCKAPFSVSKILNHLTLAMREAIAKYYSVSRCEYVASDPSTSICTCVKMGDHQWLH